MRRPEIRPVRGLREVEFVPKPPFPLLKPKQRAAKAGLNYERKVIQHFGKFYATLVHGPWIRYVDQTGEHYCQPDGLETEAAILLESKYTEVPDGKEKLLKVYGPLVERLLGRPVKMVLVFKNAVERPNPDLKIKRPTDLLIRPPGLVHTYQYLG